MAFFDKLKKGVSDAGTKAKIMVEVNRLNLQINQKESEIKSLYQNIGELVFKCVQTKNLGDIKDGIQEFCESIIVKENEIKELKIKIKEINNQKECTCGQSVSLDCKFCPHCGFNFEA